MAPTPSCSSPLQSPCFPLPPPSPGGTQVRLLALMPNPDCCPSSLAASRCDTAELVKQAWLSARCAVPGAGPISLHSLAPSYSPRASPCLSWGLGEAGAFLAKSPLPIRVYVLLRHAQVLQSRPLMPLSANFRALGAGGTAHSSLHANYAHLTPERREREGMSVDAVAGFLLRRLCPPEQQLVSMDGHMGNCRMGRIRESAKKKKGKSRRQRQLKQIWCGSGECVCVHMHLCTFTE